MSFFIVLDVGNLATRLVSKRSVCKFRSFNFQNLDRNSFSVTVREQPKISALFMTKNSPTVSKDSGENSKSFASVIGAVSIEFWSERIVTFFRSEIDEKIFTKVQKKYIYIYIYKKN